MNAVGILLPLIVHLFCIDGRSTVEEAFLVVETALIENLRLSEESSRACHVRI